MKPCRRPGCGHDRDFHEHYRAGTECGVEGCGCPSFCWFRWWWTLRASTAEETAEDKGAARKKAALWG